MSDSSSGGIGFFGLLTLLLIGLKLGGVIAWNWFWVLSPMLPPIAAMGLVVAFGLFLFAMGLVVKVARR